MKPAYGSTTGGLFQTFDLKSAPDPVLYLPLYSLMPDSSESTDIFRLSLFVRQLLDPTTPFSCSSNPIGSVQDKSSHGSFKAYNPLQPRTYTCFKYHFHIVDT